MKNSTDLGNRTSLSLTRLIQILVTAVALLVIPVAGFTQETTSSIRGVITGPDGTPMSGASVRIVDTRTGRFQVASTSGGGRYQFGSMVVGGPYSVTVNAANAATQTVTDVYLALGQTYELNLALSPEQIEEIVVTAAMVETAQVAVGPNSTFNFEQLQNLPSINRDIRDIIRVDPRVYIDEGFSDAVQCVGANPRFNSITVDGVKQNDNFGLNSSGYPTQRMPFPFDSIQNVSIEMAPFDVQYGGFTACNINAVTRSGDNEWSGRGWYDYTDDGYTGDKLEGTNIVLGSFEEKRYGFSIGGPILQDKLFVFAAYEKAETADIFDQCSSDASCGNQVNGVTQAQLDRIENIAQTLYGYDPGSPVSTLPNEDEKYLIRLDWNINDQHRAALTYSYNDGFNFTRSDDDADEYEFSNHFYQRGAELEAWSGQFFSEWNDRFSTEIRAGTSTLDNRQISRDTAGFGEVQVETWADPDGDGFFESALVYLGGDDSRQSNKLKYDTTNFKLAGTYNMGNHLLTAGYEYEEIDIFNLFVQHTIGEYRFDEDCNGALPDGCIDQFELFQPDDIFYGNHVSLDPNGAAASFAYATHSLYVQDEYNFDNADLTVIAGLRYDWYTSDDYPAENPNFVARNGFSNRQNFDGESLLQPRVAFRWNVNDELQFHGGFGLFSGGNPNVWLANNYQNDGFTQIQTTENDVGGGGAVTPLNAVPLGLNGTGSPIFDAPQALINFVNGNMSGDSAVNAVDPNFTPPSNWKFALGGIYEFTISDWSPFHLSADVIFTRGEDSAIIRDATHVQYATSAVDGRPLYMTTNKQIAGCEADPLGAGCARNPFNNDFLLSNVKSGDVEQTSLSFVLSQAYDFGIDWSFAYAWTDSKEATPMTSSVAFSNYISIAVSDPENPGRGISNYEIEHRFVARLGWTHAFFGDYNTRVNLLFTRNSGRPFSYTMDQDFQVAGLFGSSDSRSLLYVPTGPSDPNVIFDPGFDQQGFFDYAAAAGLTKYGGGIAPRNEFNAPWWSKMDLRVSQDIPGFSENHYAQVFFIIENLTNLLNDDWGVYYEQSFPRTRAIAEVELNDNGTPADFTDDRYEFLSFFPLSSSRVTSPSLWSMRLGFSYNF